METDIFLHCIVGPPAQMGKPITTSGQLIFDSTIRLGRRDYNDLEHFKGLIDEIAFYWRALSAEEINARYLGGPPVPVPEPASGLLLVAGIVPLAAALAWRRKKRSLFLIKLRLPPHGPAYS